MIKDIDFSESSPTLLRIFVTKYNQASEETRNNSELKSLFAAALGLVMAEDLIGPKTKYSVQTKPAKPTTDNQKKLDALWLQALATLKGLEHDKNCLG